MVILRQEHIFKCNLKVYRKLQGKFIDCWMILTHEFDGPTLSLFKDQSAKKPVENRLVLCPLASRIRFGTTTLNVQTGSIPPPIFFPQIKASDVRAHASCFILIQAERLVRKQRRPHFIWLCAKSTQQLFDIVKAISSCLVSMKVGAPLSNPMDDLNALHKYRPKPFEAQNDWENFFDNPPKTTTNLEPTSSNADLRSSGIAMSMDAINVMQMQGNSNKLDWSKKKTAKQTVYSSSPALETQQHSLQQNSTNGEMCCTRSSRRSSTTSTESLTLSHTGTGESRTSHSRAYPKNSNFVLEEALPPIYELKRDRELTERSKASNKSRIYEPKGGGSTMETVYSTSIGKSSSKKPNRYSARRESALSNSGFESGDTSPEILAFGNTIAAREIVDPSNEYPPGPHSILKKFQTQPQQTPKHSSGSGGYTSSSTLTRSIHTQTSKKSSSSRRRPSEMSEARVNIPTLYGSVPKYIAIQNLDSSAIYTDTEAQTEHNRAGSLPIPLISIGTAHKISCSQPAEDDFQSQVEKLKQVSQPHILIDTLAKNDLSNDHAAPLRLSLAPPTATIRKLTPTSPNPIALAAVAVAAVHNKQGPIKNNSHFSSSEGGSISSDFDDEDNQSNNAMENSSGVSTPKMVNNGKDVEERVYRISVEGTSKY